MVEIRCVTFIKHMVGLMTYKKRDICALENAYYKSELCFILELKFNGR